MESARIKSRGCFENFRKIARFRKQCEASENSGTLLFRPLEYERPARIRKKAMAKEAWYRPNYDVVGFFPVTPGGVLASQIRKFVAKEGEKIGVKFKIVETPGPSIASQITRPDLSGCVYPNCNIEEGGASHLRRGANYTGSCQVSGCEARYRGETGFGGHARISGKNGHQSDIRLRNQKNSHAQHLHEQHPEHEGNINSIKFKVTHNNKKPLERIVREAVQLAADVEQNPDDVINGQLEFVRPAGRRMTFGDLLPDRGATPGRRRTGQ